MRLSAIFNSREIDICDFYSFIAPSAERKAKNSLKAETKSCFAKTAAANSRATTAEKCSALRANKRAAVRAIVRIARGADIKALRILNALSGFVRLIGDRMAKKTTLGQTSAKSGYKIIKTVFFV